jgi:hypothetical protein
MGGKIEIILLPQNFGEVQYDANFLAWRIFTDIL